MISITILLIKDVSFISDLACAKQHNMLFMTDKDIAQIKGDIPEKKKKHRVETRIIKKYSLCGYADCVMSSINRNAREYPHEEMLKAINERGTLDMTDDIFIC